MVKNKEVFNLASLLAEVELLAIYLRGERPVNEVPRGEMSDDGRKADRYARISNLFVENFWNDPHGDGGKNFASFIIMIFKCGDMEGIKQILPFTILIKLRDKEKSDKENRTFVSEWLRERIDLSTKLGKRFEKEVIEPWEQKPLGKENIYEE